MALQDENGPKSTTVELSKKPVSKSSHILVSHLSNEVFMTTIAWNNRYIAADRQMNDNGVNAITTKLEILRTPSPSCWIFVIAHSGSVSLSKAMSRSITDGSDWPKSSDDEYASIVVIKPQKTVVEMYDDTRKIPITVEDDFYAMGSGRKFALGAMHSGQNPMQAVQAAIELDPYSGGGVDYGVDYIDLHAHELEIKAY